MSKKSLEDKIDLLLEKLEALDSKLDFVNNKTGFVRFDRRKDQLPILEGPGEFKLSWFVEGKGTLEYRCQANSLKKAQKLMESYIKKTKDQKFYMCRFGRVCSNNPNRVAHSQGFNVSVTKRRKVIFERGTSKPKKRSPML